MEAESITVAITDESHGYAVSPERVPLGLLSEFAADVQAFIRGSDKDFDAAAIEVAIVDGSFALASEPMVAPSLFRDLSSLRESADLAHIDSKRKAVIAKWQASAKNSLSRVIKIASGALNGIVVIDRTTDYRLIEAETWVDVERYIQGELMDLGGMKKSNAHIKLPDGSKITIKTDRDLIRAETDNLVYRNVHVRIRAKYNVNTGEMKDAALVEFVDYSPAFDEEAFERLTSKGRQAWADVKDPAAWVRQLRGSEE